MSRSAKAGPFGIKQFTKIPLCEIFEQLVLKYSYLKLPSQSVKPQGQAQRTAHFFIEQQYLLSVMTEFHTYHQLFSGARNPVCGTARPETLAHTLPCTHTPFYLVPNTFFAGCYGSSLLLAASTIPNPHQHQVFPCPSTTHERHL